MQSSNILYTYIYNIFVTSLQKVATTLDSMLFVIYSRAVKEKNHKGILILENVFYFSEKKKEVDVINCSQENYCVNIS